MIIQSFATYIITLEEQDRFTRDALTGNVTGVGGTSTQQLDNIVALTWLLLLVREACTALTSWAEVDNTDMMMEVLIQKMAVPNRESSCKIDTFQIGSMFIKQPKEKNCLSAKQICSGLSKLLVNISYGSKT